MTGRMRDPKTEKHAARKTNTTTGTDQGSLPMRRAVNGPPSGERSV
jgi:hypothetical protein